MKFKKTKFFILLSLFLFAFIIIAISYGVRGVHNFEGKCSFCHLGEKQPELLTASPDFLCKSCHQDVTERSHPSDFFVKRKINSRFPLMNGKMTCITCHYAHKAYGSENKAKRRAENYPYLLRYREAGKAFCMQCHKIDELCDECESYHSTSFGLAHTKVDSPEVLKILDRSSRDCMSCHNGVIASSGGDEVSVVWNHTTGIGLSHPIGVNYELVYQKDPERYYPPSALPPEIRLINGKVECLTCHDHYSKIRGKLVMSNRKSRLCLSCHNL